MLLLAVLLLFVLVISGTILNVVSASLGLGLVPEFPGSEWPFIIKNYVADAVLWVIFIAMAAFAITTLKERRRRRLLVVPRPSRKPDPTPSVVVALTAYNDELSIGAAVEDFKDRPGVERVIVVDNNSRDRTAEVAQQAGALVVGERRQGYGYCCTRGLRAGLDEGADVIVLCEGDGTFSGNDIAKLMPFLQEADMVVGNRITPGLVDRRSQMNTFFVWGNQLGAKLLQLRFWDWQFMGRLRLSDLGCTFRAIRRESLAEMIDDLNVGGNYFSPHMIMVSLSKGHTVVEVPVTFWPRVGESKGANSLIKAVAIGAAMFWHILTFGLRPTHPNSTGPRQTL